MNYRIKIFGIDGAGTPVTTLTDMRVRGWAKAINGARNMAFSLQKSHPKATPENLQKGHHVTLFRRGSDGYAPVWHGFIRADREVGNEKVVECVGLLEILEKRETAEDEVFNGQGSAEVFDLLDDVNTESDTGILEGTGGVTTTRDVKASGHETVLSMIDKLALAHGAEYEVDDTRHLNFVESLGEDKSDSIHLVFRRDGQPGTNLDQMEIGEDASGLATRVIGYSGDMEYTYDNEEAQETYGLLIERKNFNEAQDLATLTAMTIEYGVQVSRPATDFRAVPTVATKTFRSAMGNREVVGLEYGDVAPGDLVKVTVITGNASVSSVRRVAEVSVSVSSIGRETLSFVFADEEVHITASSSGGSRNFERRLSKLERTSGGGGGATDHGALSGLSDDDHTQYFNQTRGDARYALTGHNHSGVYDPAGTAAGAVTTHESTYDHSKLHDAVTIVDTDTVDLSLSTQQISAAVRLQMSLTSDASGVKLSGDAATPGNSKYYGTDGGGTKGFHALPAAGAGDVTGPATNTDNYVPQWDGANSKALKNGLAVGTAANNLVQLNGDAKLPAVDGSLLTNLAAGGNTWLEVQVFS